jgi:hypothetical protein
MLLGKYIIVIIAILVVAWMIGGLMRQRTRRR